MSIHQSEEHESLAFERAQSAVVEALYQWDKGVMEPPRGVYVDKKGNLLTLKRGEYVSADPAQVLPSSAHHIIQYIEEGLEWPRTQPYRNTGKLPQGFEWCGAFAAYCFRSVGLKKDIRYRHMASTYRLYEYCVGTPRKISVEDIKEGDIVVVGRKGSRSWGSHITICEQRTPKGALTVEGNAHGRLFSGSWGEGVIRRERPFLQHSDVDKNESYIMHAYRWLWRDYDPRDFDLA